MGSYGRKQVVFRKFEDIHTWETIYKKPENWEGIYSKETITEFKKSLLYLEYAWIYAERIDYLVSGDDGEDSFHKRLAEELEHLKNS